MMRHVKAGSVTFGNDLPLVFICGPCQIESRAHALETAAALKEMISSNGSGARRSQILHRSFCHALPMLWMDGTQTGP